MSEPEYYHIKGYIFPEAEKGNPSNKMEVEVDIPTAPMYRDLDTYNGKCAIWLKHIVLGNADAGQGAIIRAFLSQTQPVLVMKGTPSLNQIGLEVNRGQLYPNGSHPFLPSVASSRVEARGGFRDATFYCPFNTSHLDFDNSGDGGVKDADRFVSAAVGAGDGTAGNAPASSLLIDNAKYYTEYFNPMVGNMADAVIVNNIWGKRQVIAFEGFKKLLFNGGQVQSLPDYHGDISFELVIQPLKNEPIYRGMPTDEKERR